MQVLRCMKTGGSASSPHAHTVSYLSLSLFPQLSLSHPPLSLSLSLTHTPLSLRHISLSLTHTRVGRVRGCRLWLVGFWVRGGCGVACSNCEGGNNIGRNLMKFGLSSSGFWVRGGCGVNALGSGVWSLRLRTQVPRFKGLGLSYLVHREHADFINTSRDPRGRLWHRSLPRGYTA